MTETLGQTASARQAAGKTAVGEPPTRRLGREVQNLATAAAERALSSVTSKLDGVAGRLTDYIETGESGLLGAVTGRSGSGLLGSVAQALTGEGGDGGHPVRAALGAYAREKIKGVFHRGGEQGKRGKGSRGKGLKVTNIVESIDIGAPLRLVYDQWTRFEDFPAFMKKVESVEQKSDQELAWKAQIWWSHRTWKSTIIEQVPDSRIIWRSKGPKGHVDGAVTFHALTPDLTRVLLVLEYHPQGFMEGLGNLWRAQGRRVRLELKHFRRHVMLHALPHPEEIKGWRGEIHEGQVVAKHQTAAAQPDEREPDAAEREEPEISEERPPHRPDAESEPETEVADEYATARPGSRRGGGPREGPVRRGRSPITERAARVAGRRGDRSG